MAILSALVYLPLKTPLKMFVVLSGSMNPVIPAGSIVMVEREPVSIQKGEVITFIHPNKPLEFVTHRVINVESQGNTAVYQTKGDANNIPDQWVVKKEAVWGKATFVVPFLGYLINFAKTKLGVVLIIALPLFLIAASEMTVIVKEIKRLRQAKIKLPQLD